MMIFAFGHVCQNKETARSIIAAVARPRPPAIDVRAVTFGASIPPL